MIDAAEAAALYRSGISSEGVGLLLGAHGSTVRHHLMAAGVEMRPRSWLSAAVMDRIVELYSSGLHAPAVAAEVGCHRYTVYRVLRRRGVPRRIGGWRPRTPK